MREIFGGRGHFPQDKVLNAEMSRLYLGVIVFGHRVLVSGHSLLNDHPYLVQQIQVQTDPLFILPFIMVGYPVACYSHFCGDDNLAPEC